MDKSFFKKSFSLTNVPHWPCPTCRKGRLKLNKEDFKNEYNGATEVSKSDDAFDYDWVEFVFHGMLRCDSCKEKVVFGGRGGVEPDYDDSERGWSYYDYFQPKYFFPGIRLISIVNVDEVPDQVLASLDKACELFWNDLDSSANRIRTAVEYILDDLKVPRRKGMTLHARIEALDSVTHADAKTLLEAVKWIGNAGTHEMGGLHRDSVIDGFQMLEHCLSILYPKPPEDVTSIFDLAKAINTAKGPVRRKK